MVPGMLDMPRGAALEQLGRAGFTDPGAALSNLRLLSSGPVAPVLERVFEGALASPSSDRALNNIEQIASAVDARIVRGGLEETRSLEEFSNGLRLRPCGSAGPLVVSRSALLGCHAGPTSVWERQAVLKARAIAGDAAFGARVLGELAETVFAKPLTVNDINEMLRIRKRMEAEIAKETSTRYNVKTGLACLRGAHQSSTRWPGVRAIRVWMRAR